jgi:hypothetical protein
METEFANIKIHMQVLRYISRYIFGGVLAWNA